jgi:TonB-linked SusC/RagA family outer membrane protein
MKKLLWLLFLQVLATNIYAQKLDGRIIDDANSKPISGVTIKIIKSNKIARSDDDGRFSFSLPAASYELEFMTIGYEKLIKTVTVPGSHLAIAMKPLVQQLDEVVVNTGYQKIGRERLTGSFSYVGKELFNQQIGKDVISRLEGITPALTVDRRTLGASMMVRGLSTLQGDRSPLIILDDFPYVGDINNINPNDVENITILKDAAASAIWGAKAGNGVIVITTKKAAFNSTIKINANASVGLLQKPTLSEFSPLSTSDFIDVEQLLFSKGYYTNQENSTNRIPLTPVIELLIAKRDGKITDVSLQDQLSQLRKQNIVINYKDAFLGTAVNRQYSLDLRGGSAKHNWYVLAGYDDNKGALANSDNRLNLKLQQAFKFNDRLDMSLGVFLTQSKATGGRPSLTSLTANGGLLPPYTSFVAEDGSALPVMKMYRQSFLNGLGNGKLLDWNYYPLTDWQSTVSENKLLEVLTNIKLNYKLTSYLGLALTYQYQKAQGNVNATFGTSSYYTRDLVNQFSQVSGTDIVRALPLGAISNDSQSILEGNNFRAQLNLDKDWDAFKLTVIGGGELRSSDTKYRGATTYGINEGTLQSTPVDEVNAYKNIVYGSNAYIPYNNDSYSEASRYVSVFANGMLSYEGRYTITGSGRRDASNLYGVATNDLWNPLWSAGFAWLISEEPLLKTKYLPYAKLRVTYGSSGNSDSRNAAVTTLTFGSINSFTRLPYAGFSNYANPDLRWETVKTFNIGVDLKWFNSRLSASIEYYQKRSIDLIANDPIDYTNGVGISISRNAAKISARGLDIDLTSKNMVGEFKWTTSLFANFYRDRVDKYYLSSKSASRFVNGNLSVSGVEGGAVYSVYGYRWAGLNPLNGNPRGYVNGVLSEDYVTIVGSKSTLADIEYVGRAFPILSGAFANGFKWKGFNVDVRLAYKIGYYFRRPSLSYANLYASRSGNAEYAKRWQQSGDELVTNVPSAIYPSVTSRDGFYAGSTATIEKGDHVRLQYVSAGYSFNRQQYKGLPFSQITLRAVANNSGVLWTANKLNLDPDYPTAVPSKIYSFNLQIEL